MPGSSAGGQQQSPAVQLPPTSCTGPAMQQMHERHVEVHACSGIKADQDQDPVTTCTPPIPALHHSANTPAPATHL
jgi:hypothetical protein